MKNCPASQLSGFPPSSQTVQSWMEKLKANGITDGCLCRLVHGRDEDKIVKFENYDVNDLGVCIDGGYFLFQDGDTLKVAEPLFVPLLELTEDVMFFGGAFQSEKFMYKRSTNGFYVETSENAKCLDDEYTERDFWKDQSATIPMNFYRFRTARDLFAWMALND